MSINKIIKVDVENDDDEEEIKMTKEQRDFIIKNNTQDVMTYIETYNYLVIDMEHTIKLYKSLRELAKELNVSPSGISKKLKFFPKL